jgi:hypothetical protein
MFSKKALAASVSAPPAVYIEDVFSTYLYTGNGTSQTITNGVDLTKGGLVWIKERSPNARANVLFDSARDNFRNRLSSNLSDGQAGVSSSTWDITSVSSTGFNIGVDGYAYVNENNAAFVSWTFRKQAKFFDVVTFTAPASGTIVVPHNLGSTPGCVITKATGISQFWIVNHRSLASNQYLGLSTTSPQAGGAISYTADASNVTFSAGYLTANATYVMYLFAHDAGGFGAAGTDNVISCGAFVGTGGIQTVTLGYEPQWLLFKNADATSNWVMVDNMRGWGVASSTTQNLFPNLSDVEANANYPKPTSTGFEHAITAGNTCVYIAIRRGPMKTPTSGTSVYSGIARSGTGASATVSGVGFAPDFVVSPARTNGYGTGVYDRLRGANNVLVTTGTAAEVGDTSGLMSFTMDGITVGSDTAQGYINATSITYINYFFRRAPGFFDVVCYSGTGADRTITHNLGVAPEMIIFKRRDSTGWWMVYHTALGAGNVIYLHRNFASGTWGGMDSTSPTSTQITLDSADIDVNASGGTYVSYLFASVSGVSKVGSYTGNGSNQTINCGFTAGARFVMIKRTDSTGDWYVWDTARGIVSGNDSRLSVNSSAAEVTTDDSIDPDNSGFIVNQLSATNINVNTATYIYLAIA